MVPFLRTSAILGPASCDFTPAVPKTHQSGVAAACGLLGGKCSLAPECPPPVAHTGGMQPQVTVAFPCLLMWQETRSFLTPTSAHSPCPQRPVGVRLPLSRSSCAHMSLEVSLQLPPHPKRLQSKSPGSHLPLCRLAHTHPHLRSAHRDIHTTSACYHMHTHTHTASPVCQLCTHPHLHPHTPPTCVYTHPRLCSTHTHLSECHLTHTPPHLHLHTHTPLHREARAPASCLVPWESSEL